ncbi:MAG: tRNA (N(6)-L-threonylcarbamoyladenosine(37)-C(2))-methylthiotransferase MtaB [Flavobacteriales bacterium]|nr:tRNA (N(6)-L-threonylcarbamoyladenosine(37)-C(2))-methylthiotransferase MtaB [Flavobacteriales bacterium]
MQQFKKVAFYTLGCKLNFSETSTIARQLVEAGYARVQFEDDPDVFVINTCSVTDNADKKCRWIVRKALRVNPDAAVIVIGCYAQLKPDEIAQIEGVNLVLGAEEKFNVAEYLERSDIASKNQKAAREIKHTREFIPGFSSGDRTRTFLKVQDGCNYFCAFCTIPLARGRSRSASIKETLKVAREAAESGAKEVVLTGVNIGDFGHGTRETLMDLITELENVDGIQRYRISSIEPNLLTDEIIDYVANSRKFVPHFHIPLQSGSDGILAAMRRRYRTDLYRERIAHIKAKMPDACIGVDVIVGFPGESDEEFMQTYDFLHSLDISYLHVFTYSERPNTTAVRLKEVLPMKLRQERNKKLRILSHKKKKAFYLSQIGRSGEVLFEAEESGGWMNGFTENYVKVKFPYDESLVNEICEVSLDSIDRDGMVKVALKTPVHV